jgi:hypothetical protein
MGEESQRFEDVSRLPVASQPRISLNPLQSCPPMVAGGTLGAVTLGVTISSQATVHGHRYAAFYRRCV